MEKKIKGYRYVFLLCLILSFGTQFIYIISDTLTLTLLQKIVIVMIQILSIGGYSHFYLYNQSIEKRIKGIKYVHWIVFVIYCLNLFYVLFLDPDFGRQMFKTTLTFEEYLEYNVNLDLFETIQLFIQGYHNGVVSLETLLRNIIGNMVVFMPMGYFLPYLFKKQRKFMIFFITIFFIVLGVEILQVFLRIGSGDIDDLFLNVVGSLLMYLILRCLPIGYRYHIKERE